MIAPQAIPTPPPGPRQSERIRTATRRRTRRTRRRNTVAFARMAALIAIVSFPIMGYVTATAHLTGLSYALERATHERSILQDETLRLDDRIAGLESRDRLASVAAQLHMHDPSAYVVVTLPGPAAPAPARHGIAFLGTASNWFKLP
jgi:cell division protein FtsL